MTQITNPFALTNEHNPPFAPGAAGDRGPVPSSAGRPVNPPRRGRGIRCGAAATMVVVIALALPAQAEPTTPAVARWNETATRVVLATSQTATPSASAIYVAIAQAAVYNAVMAIEGTHTMYRSSLTADRPASVDAAVATAAHDVLVHYFPAEQAALHSQRDADLAAVADGPAKANGMRVGRAAAAELITMREHDGRFASVPEPADGDEPGEWRRTSPGPAVTPWTAQVAPFMVNSPEQFRADGPDPLTSDDYAAQFDEVRRYGAKTGSARSPEQTEIARFWTENTVGQYGRAIRGFVAQRRLTNADAARLLATTWLTAADAIITCWNSKYTYLRWRPVTAIRLADTDGNPSTAADPLWEPLSVTGNHPEYTSGHACLTGAITRSLETFLGSPTIDLTMDAKVTGTTVHHFRTVDALRTEVENARIYGGDHFRGGGTDGTRTGDHVAKWALARHFLAVGRAGGK